jgi:hypothetical protein
MNISQEFNWAQELEKTVVHSLTTTFGLDFLFFEDKKGGGVNTIHNVRQGIYATKEEAEKYTTRDAYDKDIYHKHENYVARGRSDKEDQLNGTLIDRYRGIKIEHNDTRDLDHIISAKNIHNDPGRILAEIDGSHLANQDSNLQSTGQSINRSKSAKKIPEFLAQVQANLPKQEANLRKKQAKLHNMSRGTPAEQHEYRSLEDAIRKERKKIDELRSIDQEAMLAADHEANKSYNQNINRKYYTSSKFIKQSAFSAAESGLQMGTRQMLGLILAEMWFELREQLPALIKKHNGNFQFNEFIGDIKEVSRKIWDRLKIRFTEFLNSFKEGVFSGILSSATTTLFNIFATTEKIAVKLIREMWSHIIQAFKTIVFNPERLGMADLARTVANIIAAGVAAIVGTMIYSQLTPILNFPFGAEIAAFISALCTGIISLGLQYFINHSALMKKFWDFMGELSYTKTLEEFRRINARLDDYIQELAKIEFNFNQFELESFSNSLHIANGEIEKSIVLQAEISRRNIDLPFQIGDHDSTKKWLKNLTAKK